MEYNSFEDMPVWQKSTDLAVKVFNLTERLPRKEDYGLTSQIRSSALSVPGNLAETKSHLIYGHKVRYFTDPEFREHSKLIEDIWKELNSLINSLSRRI
jgi:hypothetical protein